MAATIYHSLTMTTPDDTRYENKPTDWNKEHLMTLSAAGSLTTTVPTVSFMGVGEYSLVTYTPGSGWAEDLDSAIMAQSRSDVIPGVIDPVATCSVSMDWSACSASFAESNKGIVGWLAA